MNASTLYQIVVRMKAELGNLKPGMAEAAQAVDAGATKIEAATKRVDAASDGLGSTLEKQTGVLTSAAQATSGLSGATAFLATGLGLAAAAGVAYGAIALQVSRETERQANAITLTGNAAGLVAGQINASARSVAASLNGMVGNARETMEALVATGQVGGESLESVAKGVELVAQFSSKSRDAVTSDFASMGDGVAKWAAKHNEQYHYLTLDQYKYIEGLEKAGETQKAMAANSDILAQHLGGDLTKNLGTLEKAWQGVRNWASRAWDAMLDIGREDTLAQQIEAIDKQLNYLATQKTPKRGTAVQDQLRESLLARKAELQANQANESANAYVTAEAAKRNKKEIDDYIDGQKKKGSSRAVELSDYDKLIEKLSKEVPRAAAEAEGAQLGYNKAQIEFLALTKSDEWAKFTAAQRATVTALYERKAASEMVEKATKDELKTASDVAKTRQAMLDKETNSVTAWMNAQQAASEKALASVRNRATSLQDEEAAATLAARKNISLAQAIEEVTIARLQEKQSRFWEGSEGYQAVQQEIDARRELLTLINSNAQREETENFWKSIDQTAHDTFVNVADWGDNAFKRIGKTLQSAVLDVLYQMTIKKWIVSVGASISDTASSAASSLAGGSGGLGSLSNLASLGSTAYQAITGNSLVGSALSYAGVATGAGAAAGSAGVIAAGNAAYAGAVAGGASAASAAASAGVAAGTAATGTGAGIVGGMSSALAAVPVYGWVALAAAAIFSVVSGKGETRSGGQYDTNQGLLAAPSGGEIGGDAVQSAMTATVDGLNGLFKDLGSSASVTYYNAGLESSKNGKGFTYAGGTLSTGQQFGAGFGSGYMNNRGDKTPEEAAAQWEVERQQSIVQALQAATDLPEVIKSMLQVDANSLDSAGVQNILSQINTMTVTVKSFGTAVQDLPFENLKNLTFDATAGLISLNGGVESVASKLDSFSQNYFSEAERTATTTASVAKTLGSLGLAMPDLSAGSAQARAQLRSYIEAQDLNTEAGRAAWTALMNITDAFASITPEANSAADAAKAAADELVDSVGAVFDVLKSSVADLYGSVGSTAGMQASAAQAFIDQALSTAQKTGYLPDSDALSEAIAAARSGVENGTYASAAEEQRARLLLAGKLDALLQISGKQLNAAESAAGQALTTIPAFANGGDHSGGLRLVGENGWEVEATGPARYWNQAQLGQALSGASGVGGEGRVQALLAQLVSEVAEMRRENRVGVVAQQYTYDMLKQFNGQGLPPTRETV